MTQTAINHRQLVSRVPDRHPNVVLNMHISIYLCNDVQSLYEFDVVGRFYKSKKRGERILRG